MYELNEKMFKTNIKRTFFSGYEFCSFLSIESAYLINQNINVLGGHEL